MQIPKKTWDKYIKQLSSLNYAAGTLIKNYVEQNGIENTKALTDYAYNVIQKYGNGSAALSAAMYDALATLEKAKVAPAIMAELPDYGEVAKAIYGTLKTSQNPSEIGGATSRLVKRCGADTTLKNAERDRAQFAWIPAGDTCAFCLTLASNGWQYMSKDAMRNGHAEHIHSNCDCTYAVRFDESTDVAGYDPEEYREIYDNAEGRSSKDKINSMRRMQYQENKDRINAQKREAYAERNGNTLPSLNNATNDSILSNFEQNHYKDSTESGILIKNDGTITELGGIDHAVVGDQSILTEMDGGTFTHNHPLDVTFSSPDIANGIVTGNLKELRAVTSKGNLHILENNASLEDRRKFNALYSEAQKKFERIANEKLRRGETFDKPSYIEERKEKWLEENAPKYGLKYKKSKI